MQQLNPSEISDIIKQRIASMDLQTEARNEGTIVSVSDGIIRIHGMAEARYGEMIEFSAGGFGLALNLERDSVGAVVLGTISTSPKVKRHDARVASLKCLWAGNWWAGWSTRWVTPLTVAAIWGRRNRTPLKR